MTRKTRTILFLICSFLLFSTAPAVILYSAGYRFDLQTKKIVQTGGFSCKVLPKSAEIYINEKFKKKTDILFGTALIKNLLPKTYKIEIKKDGYYSWEKTLEIKEKQVTEAKNVVLIPKEPAFNILDKNIKKFWFSPDQKKIILLKEEKGWILELFDLEKNSQNVLPFSISNGTNLAALEFSPDSKKLLLETKRSATSTYFVLELNPPVIFSLDFFGKGVEKLSFDSQVSQTIFFIESATTTKSLFRADYNKKEISQPIIDDLAAYKTSGSDIIWLSSQGFLYRNNSAGKILETLNLKPLELKPETDYEIKNTSSKIFLKENSSLYLLDDSKEFKKISDSVNNFRFSPNFQKIVYFNNYEIWLLFLEKQEGQPPKQAGEKVFLTRFSEKIDDCFWLTGHYLIFNAGEKIRVAEIDDRNKINIVDLVEFRAPKIFFSQGDKKLYILSEGNLYQSKKLY